MAYDTPMAHLLADNIKKRSHRTNWTWSAVQFNLVQFLRCEYGLMPMCCSRINLLSHTAPVADAWDRVITQWRLWLCVCVCMSAL